MINLQDYGFIPGGWPENNKGIPARIVAVHRERYALICEHGEAFGRLKASVYYHNSRALFPTVGDFVGIVYRPDGDSQIITTLPRRTFFARLDPMPGREEQAIAANFDTAFILQSLNRDWNPKRLERYLALAKQSGAVPVVLLTKADLADEHGSYLRAAKKIAGNADVFAVSAKTGFGLENLVPYFAPGKTVVLLGSSGVGKSSLVNAFAGEEIMAVGEIREDDDRGRHTTSHRQLFRLRNGAMVIDTPGMRALGMWEASAGLDEAFADVEQFFGKCKFRDCRHQNEPGCAIRAAIASGELSLKRWESYTALKNESEQTSGRAMQSGQPRRNKKRAAQPETQKADFRENTCEEGFQCKVCGAFVSPEGAGSRHRNHCPKCLSSLHLDEEPGDRASLCHGVMEPVSVWVRKGGEWAVIHRCRQCGALHSNRIAADDNPALLFSLAVRPLALPPFPLDQLDRLLKE